jgi:hypothetical protein
VVQRGFDDLGFWVVVLEPRQSWRRRVFEGGQGDGGSAEATTQEEQDSEVAWEHRQTRVVAAGTKAGGGDGVSSADDGVQAVLGLGSATSSCWSPVDGGPSPHLF